MPNMDRCGKRRYPKRYPRLPRLLAGIAAGEDLRNRLPSWSCLERRPMFNAVSDFAIYCPIKCDLADSACSHLISCA